NEDLRKQYEAIHKEIDGKAEALISDLKPRSGLREGNRAEFANSITHDRKEFYRALGRLKDEVRGEKDTPLADVVYSHIFNPKVAELLVDPSFREKIRTYIEKYDALLSKSTFFQKGVFTHNNAADIAKNLQNNGFFKANHSVF